jgi:STE24 endopeptidase
MSPALLLISLVAAVPVPAPRQGTQPALAPDSVSQSAIPEAARLRPGARFDPEAATAAYLATVPPDKRARSDAYFEGGYWIRLWGFLLTMALLVLVLHLGWSRRVREWAERRSGRYWAQAFLYYAAFVVLMSALSFPFDVYAGFVREHQYGLATQGLGGWMRDLLVALGVSALLGGIAVATLYAVLRRFPRSWPTLGAATMIVFLILGVLIAPVVVAPLFNKYTLLSDPRVRDPILRLARANGVPADRVYVMDASRQSTRISANVSGIMGTARITLNDNLLRRASLPEIESVMGHEMGHYVLGHVYQAILFFGVLILLGFALLRQGFAWTTSRWGRRWGVRDVADPAGFPILMGIFTAYFFLLSPAINSYTRSSEAAADIFGLNASRQPDGFALIALKLAEYRKLAPGPLEEALFYDHPSGRSRIRMAMRWKTEYGP